MAMLAPDIPKGEKPSVTIANMQNQIRLMAARIGDLMKPDPDIMDRLGKAIEERDDAMKQISHLNSMIDGLRLAIRDATGNPS